jgi:hypothetical protein
MNENKKVALHFSPKKNPENFTSGSRKQESSFAFFSQKNPEFFYIWQRKEVGLGVARCRTEPDFEMIQITILLKTSIFSAKNTYAVGFFNLIFCALKVFFFNCWLNAEHNSTQSFSF